ncbi:MAG: hypothetical protein N2C14_16385, partial [Planctomycetales bacterium]
EVGVRYWAAVGLFLLEDGAAKSKAALQTALTDDCHEVRAMAAWSLFHLGEKQAARDALRGLLENHSYASLKVGNMIDWMGEGYDGYKDALAACKPPVLASYLGRVKESVLGAAAKSKGKKGKK